MKTKSLCSEARQHGAVSGMCQYNAKIINKRIPVYSAGTLPDIAHSPCTNDIPNERLFHNDKEQFSVLFVVL